MWFSTICDLYWKCCSTHCVCVCVCTHLRVRDRTPELYRGLQMQPCIQTLEHSRMWQSRSTHHQLSEIYQPLTLLSLTMVRTERQGTLIDRMPYISLSKLERACKHRKKSYKKDKSAFIQYVEASAHGCDYDSYCDVSQAVN